MEVKTREVRVPFNVRKLGGKGMTDELPAYITNDGQHVIVAVNGGWQLFQRVGKFDALRSAGMFANLVAEDASIEMDRE
jgi:hypothetical protein